MTPFGDTKMPIEYIQKEMQANGVNYIPNRPFRLFILTWSEYNA